MAPGQSSSLRMPSFLHGIYPAIHRNARAEGRRCAEQYQKNGSFLPPRRMSEVPPGDVVLTHVVSDFQRERPAWRLYMVSEVMGALTEALNWQDTFGVRDTYEAFFRETAWGALYFVVSQTGAMSAERVALRLQAVLRFWETLQSARYQFKTLNEVLTLEELMMASCDWAMDAWCPVGDASVRARLEVAAERMARATREDSIEAILRQMPVAFAHADGLKHRALLADPELLRQRLMTLEPELFAHISGAWTATLIRQLHLWDRQFESQ
ncbi:MAG: hypothetical protein JXB05_27540 [Myxococcaceae bacterium]|nr:hypothetical protein [Myxococcaceae bacterium]